MTLFWFFLFAVALLLFLLSRRRSSKQSPMWREVHVAGDESAVRYRDRAGNVQCERDGCNGCIQLRAGQLQREGFVVEEVQLGRRNSGAL